jgi:2-methylcitrate dehydratase PrpD
MATTTAATTNTNTTTVSRRLADFSAALTPASIPPEVREKCKVSLLHNLGVALAGGPLLGAPLRYAEALQEQGPGAGARLLLSGRAATPDTAAFVNATLMHARAQDDVYFPGLTHAGAIMTPAVLAAAEQMDASGEDVVTALVAGYEVVGALSQGFAGRTTPRGFRASGLYGVFGAAAGVARLMGLDAQATANAIGIAASAAGGTNQTWIRGSQEWQFQMGMGARNGLLAARLAAAGGTGAPDALEGAAGFYRAFMGDTDGVHDIGLDLGRHWRSLDVTYKPHAVCAILQGPVSQAIALARAAGLRDADITAVRLHLPPAEAAYPGTDATGPFVDTGASLMSAPFCLAVALTQHGFRGEDLRRLDDPRLAPVIARTRVIADPSLGPRRFVLEVDHADGRNLRHVAQSEGEPFNWDREGVLRNLRAMGDELPLDAAGIERLAGVVLQAERGSARDIVAACVVAAD